MKDGLSFILSDNIIKISLYSSLAITILLSILILVTFGRLPPLIPLINSQPWGIGRLYSSFAVFIIPPALVGVSILNFFLSFIYYKRNTLAARILSFNALLFIFLGFFAYVQIVLLVF